jgi:hypothetical protein
MIEAAEQLLYWRRKRYPKKTIGPAMDSNIPNTSSQSIETRLRALEDREEIRQLLINYGRTLDQRNFAAFAKLFIQVPGLET